jgi:site-specific recombinase XerD
MDLTLLRATLSSFKLAMQTNNRSAGTIRIYVHGITLCLEWCERTGADCLDRATARAWIGDMLDNGNAPATARQRLQAIKSYAKWLLAEGEIDANPLEGLQPPKLHTKVTTALSDDQVSAMIAACKGSTLADRRDEALVRFMAETGTRATETVTLMAEDVDLVARTAIIRKGKGGDGRVVPFSTQCAAAIDRYMRLRRRLRVPMDGPLWIGVGGKSFGYYGLRKTLQRRAEAAGVGRFYLHLMRHTAATRWLRQGGSEGGLMAVAGWKDRTMLDRYTRASATERAISEAERLALGDF